MNASRFMDALAPVVARLGVVVPFGA